MLGFEASCECSIASAKHGVCLGDNILMEGGGDGTVLVYSHLPTLDITAIKKTIKKSFKVHPIDSFKTTYNKIQNHQR